MPESDNDKTLVLGAGVAPAPRTFSGTRIGKSNNALPIGTHLSEFEIVDLVGEGGFGIVYLAEDHSLKRRVAIKEYMPSSLAERGEDSSVVVRSERHTDTFEVGRRSFVNEALLLAQFDHQALVKVYRFWEANGTAYMAMPFYAGRTLREVLKERNRTPDEQWIRKMLVPIMDALELIHSENCFHRDVAPDNIMVLRDERPVLLDFGAARRVISDMTQALTVILKPGFAPIEQYADMPGVKQGPWTDIYALAAVVYFMIVGRTPPPSVNRMMQDSYEPLTVIAAGRYSDRFLRGIDQCLAVRAEDRPQSIPEMRQLLGLHPDLPTTEVASREQASIFVSSDGSRQDSEQADGKQASPATILASTIVWPQPSPTPAPEPASSPAPAPVPPAAQPPQGAGMARFARAYYIGGATGAGLLAAALFFIFGKPPTPAPEAVSPAVDVRPAVTSHPVTQTGVLRQPVTLEQALTTIATGSDSSFELAVNGVRTPLTIGRDPLAFMLQSSRGGYLYLLLLDTATARLSLLFPNELDRDNLVVAGKPVVFPRSTWAYEADLPPGNWQLMAIVSSSPRRFALLPPTDGVAGIPTHVVEARLNEADHGEAALLGEVDCAVGQGCSSTYAAVRFTVEEAAAGGEKGKAAKGDTAGSTKGNREGTPDFGKMLDEMLKTK